MRCPACDAPLVKQPVLRGADRLHGTPGEFQVAALRGLPAGRLVDVGCGRGDLAVAFAARGWHAVARRPA